MRAFPPTGQPKIKTPGGERQANPLLEDTYQDTDLIERLNLAAGQAQIIDSVGRHQIAAGAEHIDLAGLAVGTMQAKAVGIVQAELNRARQIIEQLILSEAVRPAKPGCASLQEKTTKKTSRGGCSLPRPEDVVYAKGIIQRARQ